jgi:hypothetical protein
MVDKNTIAFFSPNYLQPWHNALRIASGETHEPDAIQRSAGGLAAVDLFIATLTWFEFRRVRFNFNVFFSLLFC